MQSLTKLIPQNSTRVLDPRPHEPYLDPIHELTYDPGHELIRDLIYSSNHNSDQDPTRFLARVLTRLSNYDPTHELTHEHIYDPTHEPNHDLISEATHDPNHEHINVLAHFSNHGPTHVSIHASTPDHDKVFYFIFSDLYFIPFTFFFIYQTTRSKDSFHSRKVIK